MQLQFNQESLLGPRPVASPSSWSCLGVSIMAAPKPLLEYPNHGVWLYLRLVLLHGRQRPFLNFRLFRFFSLKNNSWMKNCWNCSGPQSSPASPGFTGAGDEWPQCLGMRWGEPTWTNHQTYWLLLMYSNACGLFQEYFPCYVWLFKEMIGIQSTTMLADLPVHDWTLRLLVSWIRLFEGIVGIQLSTKSILTSSCCEHC